MYNILDILPTTEGKIGFPWTKATNPSIYDADITYPKITIITPSYNQGQFLEETIRSVLLQNYPNLEYIIIDGDSTDNSVEIIEKYEQWIDYWVSEPDKGQAHAINKGLEKATGEIFNWLNSDDWYCKNALYNVAEVFSKNKSLQVAAFKEYTIDSKNNIKRHKGTSIYKKLEATLARGHIDQPCTFFKLSVFQGIGLLREDLNYLFDTEFWIRFLIFFGQKNIEKHNIYTNYFRLHEKSKTVSQQINFHKEASILISALSKITTDDKLKKLVTHNITHNNNISKKIYKSWEEKLPIKEFDKNRFNKNFVKRIKLHFYWTQNDDLLRKLPLTYLNNYPFISFYHFLLKICSNSHINFLRQLWRRFKFQF